MRKELLVADVVCDRTDLKKFEACDWWIVESAVWHVDNQRGEVRLRQCTNNDL